MRHVAWERIDIGFALLLAALCALFFHDLLRPSVIVDSPDIIRQFYPWREFARNGSDGFQLWLPYTQLGEPLVANPQLATYYPPDRLLLRWLPTHQALDYGLIFHIILGGLFTYALARRLIGDAVGSFAAATVFVFSSYTLSHLVEGHYSLVVACAWTPLILLLGDMAFERLSATCALLGGAALGLQFLSGHPQSVFITGVALTGILFVRVVQSWRGGGQLRERFARPALWVLILVSGVGISAAQLIPTYELSKLSTRRDADYEFITDYSLRFYLLPTVAVPELFGSPFDSASFSESEHTLYLGVLPILLAALCIHLKRTGALGRILLLAAGLSVVVALGRFTPVYWLLWKFVPGFDLFRAPARFLLIFTLAMALVTGIGLKVLNGSLTGIELRRLRNFTHAVSGLALASALIGSPLGEGILYWVGERGLRWRYGPDIDGRLTTLDVIHGFASADLVRFALLLVVPLVLLYWRSRANSSPRWFATLTISFLVTNLWLVYGPFVNVIELRAVRGESAAVRFLEKHSSGDRVYDPHNVLFPNSKGRPTNSNVLYSLDTVGGYNPIRLTGVEQVARSLAASSLAESHSLLNALDVRYVVADEPLEEESLALVSESDGIRVYENGGALPRAFLVTKSDAACEGDLIQCILGAKSAAASTDPATITRPTPDELRIALPEAAEGVLVVSEIYYPGWRVFVDGRERDILRVFGLFRGVHLLPGDREATFVYSSPSVSLGKLTTAATAALMLCLFGVLAWMNGRQWRRARQ